MVEKLNRLAPYFFSTPSVFRMASTIWFHMPSGHDVLLKVKPSEDPIRLCELFCQYGIKEDSIWNPELRAYVRRPGQAQRDLPFPDAGLWAYECSGISVFIGEAGFEPPKSEYITVSYMNRTQLYNLLVWGNPPIEFVWKEREEPYDYRVLWTPVEYLDKELEQYFWEGMSDEEKSTILGMRMQPQWDSLPLWMLRAGLREGMLGATGGGRSAHPGEEGFDWSDDPNSCHQY